MKSKKFNQSLHKDTKETLVEIDRQFYKLTPTDLTWEKIRSLPTEQAPHVRHLNLIPERTSEEQEKRNAEVNRLGELASRCSPTNGKVTSLRKAIKVGADVPLEIEKLLKEKEEAKQKGDDKRQREIRRMLRKLDYKRYINNNQKGESNGKS